MKNGIKNTNYPISGTPETTIEAQRLYGLFNEFYAAYSGERARLYKCDSIYRGDHWYDVPVGDKNEPRPVTPVIQSTIENIRADLNDYLPEAVVTADSRGYERLADDMTHIVRENHLLCGYDEEFSLITHDLLVGGWAVQEVGFDSSALNGIGAAFVRRVDIRTVMFDPLTDDMQQGRAVFKFTRRTRDWFREHYPDKADDLNDETVTIDNETDGLLTPRYDDSIVLIECWLRSYDSKSDSYRVDRVLLAGGLILEDTRDVEDGCYSHGKYPFVITTLFPRSGSCLGYGFVDMFETAQRYSDKLDQIVMKNALLASHNKLLVTGASGFEPDDLRDWSKEVHKGDNLNGVTWFSTAPLPAYLISYIADMRTTIKEESGSNEWSRGMTNYGVVSGTAISALQEKSSKRARMAAKSLHSAFRQAVELELELEREFSLGLRCVRLGALKGTDAEDSSETEARRVMDMERMPFSLQVTVKVQKNGGFSALSNNDTVFRLVETGMITPEVGLELLMFDGKEQAKSLMQASKADGAMPQEG